MTAAAVALTVSTRCAQGGHNRCPGILPGSFCACRCGHPSSVNVRAAGAVVLSARALHDDDRMFRAKALELLAMIGVIDDDVEEPAILPDDVRGTHADIIKGATGNTDEPPPRLDEDQDEDDVDLVHAPRSKRLSTPPGLAVLQLPAPRQAARPKPEPKPAAQGRPRRRQAAAKPPVAAKPDPAAAERARLIAAGVDASTATVLVGDRPKPPPDSGRPRPPRQLKPISHGSLTGYTAHSVRKVPIPPDDPCGCRAARKAYDAARPKRPKPTRSAAAPKPTLLPAKRIAPVLPPIVHGTAEGWQAHHDRGALPVCEVCAAAVAPPPPKPVSAAELLAEAQRSPDRAVARAAAAGIRLLVQIQAAPPSRVDQLLSRLADALADVSRAQARAASRTNGATP